MSSVPNAINHQQVGWRVSAWAAAAKVSRSTTYNLMNGKVPGAPRLESVKIGKARVIITPPAAYVASLPRA
jgi:hypothetical protein